MKITQMKFQKIVVKAFVILSAIALFYAVAIFASPFYQFNDVQTYSEFGEYMDTTGYQMFSDIQPFNKTLFTLSIITFIVSLSLLVFFCQSRRNYYLSNYIASGVSALSNVAISIFALINVFNYRAQFTQIDFNSINTNQFWIDDGIKPVSSSTWSFDLGIVVYVLLILFSIALIVNIFWKMKAMKADKAQFATVDDEIKNRWARHEQELTEEAEKYES